MDRGLDTNLLDTHNRLIADVVSHFRALTMLATVQAEGDEKHIDPQTIAVTGMSMQMEFEALNTSIKDLLALSRRLKELWLFGRLGAEDEQAKAQAERVEQDVVRCAELFNSIQGGRYSRLTQENGGTWEALATNPPSKAESAGADGSGSAPAAPTATGIVSTPSIGLGTAPAGVPPPAIAP